MDLRFLRKVSFQVGFFCPSLVAAVSSPAWCQRADLVLCPIPLWVWVPTLHLIVVVAVVCGYGTGLGF